MTRAGAIAAFLLFGYSTVTAILLLVIGGAPETAAEAFALLQRRPFIGWLRLDVLTVIFMPMYYVLPLGLWEALQRTSRVSTAISSGMVVVGVTLFMSAPTVFSLARLSELHAMASSDSRKAELIAAAESVLAHGYLARVRGLVRRASVRSRLVVDLRTDVASWEWIPALAWTNGSGDPRARLPARTPHVDLAAFRLGVDDGRRALVPVVVSRNWTMAMENGLIGENRDAGAIAKSQQPVSQAR